LKQFALSSTLVVILACSSIIIIRVLAVKFKWRLPSF
jgi:uncharacterized membrane protein YeiH